MQQTATDCNRLQKKIRKRLYFSENKFLTQVRGVALSGARKVVCGVCGHSLAGYIISSAKPLGIHPSP